MRGGRARATVLTVIAYRSPAIPSAGYWPTACDRCGASCWMDTPTRDVVHTGAVTRVWCDACHRITRG